MAIFFLGMPSWLFAAAPDAQDYSVPAHVTKSWVVTTCGNSVCSYFVHLAVIIDGKKYELQDERQRHQVLKPGDYHAKLLQDVRGHKTSADTDYEDVRIYEFLFSDGKTRRYELVGEEE